MAPPPARAALLALALCAAAGCARALQTTGLPPGFVRVANGRFAVGDGAACSPFIFAGWNQVVEQSSQAPSPPARSLPRPGRQLIAELMDAGVAAGLTVIRFWAHSITPGWSMHPAPGVHNESIAQGLDFFLNEASKRGLRVIVVIADNWYPQGGLDQYIAWGEGKPTPTSGDQPGPHRAFFESDAIKALYKAQIGWLANRVNTLNGRRYGDDPTIMAFNLANEPRCEGCGNAPMQNWIADICAYVKSVAPRTLVGVGSEGFYGEGSPHLGENPGGLGSAWASQEGQDFLNNAAVPCVDYVGIHVWPDNWGAKDPSFISDFINGRLADAAAALPGKPFVLEEFGKKTDGDPKQKLRNSYVSAAYAAAEANVRAHGNLGGCLFWHWYAAGVGPGQYGIHATDTTFPLIEAHASFMRSSSAPGCEASTSSS